MLVGIEPYYDIMVVDPLITGTALPSGAFFGAGNRCFGNGETHNWKPLDLYRLKF